MRGGADGLVDGQGQTGLPLPGPAGGRVLDLLRWAGDERLARAAWSRLAEPGDPVAAKLVAGLGAGPALEALATRSESALDRFRPRLPALSVEADLRIAERFGARLLIPGDDEWPTGLDDLDAPPHCLWVRGPAHLGQTCARSIAIVGARAATAYGQRLAAHIAAGVAIRDVSVVSGAAFGIDAAAHRGALSREGSTIAVLACGIERSYPAGNADLIDDIATTGAVVAEAAPGSAPLRARFLMRNRLIATMTQATLVVEAGLRSGSRNTAGTAAEHHRVVMATPGPVTSAASAGCHDMIRSQMATLVTEASEVMELIGALGRDAIRPARGVDRPGDDLDPGDRRIYDALASTARSVDHVAQIAGRSTAATQACLGRLQLAGRAKRVDGGWVRCRRHCP
ncbi:MAG: DNA-processing protein DprA [Micrococcales bacterium]|nr:DNA-processing protein DprA [Micrococcales bacterium]